MNNPLVLSKKIHNSFVGEAEEEVSPSNILQVVRKGMELVGEVKLKGHEKKILLLNSIETLVDNLPVADGVKDLINIIVSNAASAVIEDLIMASNGDFKFKNSKKFCPCL